MHIVLITFKEMFSMIVCLMGHPGSGKSTMGQWLSVQQSVPFFDLSRMFSSSSDGYTTDHHSLLMVARSLRDVGMVCEVQPDDVDLVVSRFDNKAVVVWLDTPKDVAHARSRARGDSRARSSYTDETRDHLDHVIDIVFPATGDVAKDGPVLLRMLSSIDQHADRAGDPNHLMVINSVAAACRRRLVVYQMWTAMGLDGNRIWFNKASTEVALGDFEAKGIPIGGLVERDIQRVLNNHPDDVHHILTRLTIARVLRWVANLNHPDSRFVFICHDDTYPRTEFWRLLGELEPLRCRPCAVQLSSGMCGDSLTTTIRHSQSLLIEGSRHLMSNFGGAGDAALMVNSRGAQKLLAAGSSIPGPWEVVLFELSRHHYDWAFHLSPPYYFVGIDQVEGDCDGEVSFIDNRFVVIEES
jgi:hypothetical protein